MTTTRFDLAYGRQGGRVTRPKIALGRKLCVECGRAMVTESDHTKRDRHYRCDPESTVGRSRLELEEAGVL